MAQLSILIPSIPSRFDRAQKLYQDLMEKIGDRDIEVLLFMDNKKRTIGEKRDFLKNAAKGKYFMFCDDDDQLLDLDALYQATFEEVDVITFLQRCRNADGSTYIVTFGLGNQVEHNQDTRGNYVDLRRPPFHVCAWHRRFKQHSFGWVNYGEDWVFVEKALKQASLEKHLPVVVHSYNFDPLITEASTESNQYWKNPNEKPLPTVPVVTAPSVQQEPIERKEEKPLPVVKPEEKGAKKPGFLKKCHCRRSPKKRSGKKRLPKERL
jgi:hypothetical protein